MRITSENAFFELRKQLSKIEKFSFLYSHNLKKTYGITGPQIGLLRALERSGKKYLSLTELAGEVGAHITTVEGMVNRLHRSHFVHKQKNRKDKRVLEVALTEKGKSVLKEAPLGAMGQLHENLKKLPDAESQQIYYFLVKIVELCGASDIDLE